MVLSDMPGSRRSVLLRFFKILTPVVLILAALVAVLAGIHQRNRIALMEAENRQALLTEQQFVQSVGGSVVSDLMVLADFLGPDLRTAKPAPASVEATAAHFLSFASHKPIYDQLRYLDAEGREIIRVNNTGGRPVLVPEPELQPKAHRYYFRSGMTLGPDDIYISPLDLNIEHGQIEQPPKPMIRLARPIFDDQGIRRGMVVVNYLAVNLLHSIRLTGEESDQQVMMVNGDGFWLHSPDAADAFGFMYPEGGDLTMARRYPRAWTKISGDEKGFFENPEGIFTFITVHPVPSGLRGRLMTSGEDAVLTATADYYWKLVIFEPHQKVQQEARQYLMGLLWPVLLMLVAFVTAAWLLALAVERRKLAEAALRQANEDLERRVEDRTVELSRTNEALRKEMMEREAAEEKLRTTEKMRALGAVAAGIAHDFKNILLPIMAYTDMAQEDLPANSPVTSHLEGVMAAARRANALVGRIMDFGRPKEVHPSMIDLQGLVDEVVDQTRAVAPDNLTISAAVADDCPALSADPAQIHQVLTNLCRNAVQAIGDRGGAIVINGDLCPPPPGAVAGPDRDRQKWVCLTVQDDGPGIPTAIQGSIFEPHFTTKEGKGGSGLGLATVHNIIFNHGGTIAVESSQGLGTVFSIRLPVAGPALIAHSLG